MTTGPDTIEAHIPRLRRYARALTGERGSADDLVQDTLERALLKFALWQRGSDLRAWLFTIMHNVYVNQLRAKRESMYIEDPDSIAMRESESGMLDIMDLDRALQHLPVEQREVVLLVGLEQLSYQEAAAALGIPTGTVMSRLSRGRERLRMLLSRNADAAGLKVVK
jgi:RNA polymerase sigma-70 factor (ECF subfamily)